MHRFRVVALAAFVS